LGGPAVAQQVWGQDSVAVGGEEGELVSPVVAGGGAAVEEEEGG